MQYGALPEERNCPPLRGSPEPPQADGHTVKVVASSEAASKLLGNWCSAGTELAEWVASKWSDAFFGAGLP